MSSFSTISSQKIEMSKMLYHFAGRAPSKSVHCQNDLDKDLKPSKESTKFAKYCFKFEIDKGKVQNNE